MVMNRSDMGQDITRETGADILPPEARFLRRLVTGLAVIMGLGMVAITAILWLRLSAPAAGDLPPLPSGISLPQGQVPAAVTFARGGLIVVTDSGLVLFYDNDGQLLRRIDSGS